MPRKPEGPWWWESRQGFYAKINGVRHNLQTDDLKTAEKRYHALMAADPAFSAVVNASQLFAEIVGLFLAWSEHNQQAGQTYDGYSTAPKSDRGFASSPRRK